MQPRSRTTALENPYAQLQTEALKQKDRRVLQIRTFAGFSLYFMTLNIIKVFWVQVISYIYLRFIFRKSIYN